MKQRKMPGELPGEASLLTVPLGPLGGCSTYRIWAQGKLTIFTSTSAAAIGNLDRAKEETRAAGSDNCLVVGTIKKTKNWGAGFSP